MATLLVGLLIGTAAAVGITTVANAYSTTGCRWPSANVTYFANASGAYLTAYTNAANVWHTTDVNMSASSSSSLTGVAGYYGATGYDGYTGWHCNLFAQYVNAGMTLNRTYIESYAATKKRAVALHEFGHGLGLDHSSAGGWPIMYTSPATSYDNGSTSIRNDDRAGMNSVY